MATLTTTHQHRSSHLPGAVIESLGRMMKLLATWHDRSRQRRELAALPPELLKDMGIDHIDAMCEAEKPFWVE